MGSVWFAVVSVLVLVQLSFADAVMKNSCTVSSGNVYVIYPGSDCTVFAQWAINNPSGSLQHCPKGMKFNTEPCQCDLASKVQCPASNPPLDCVDLPPAGISVSGIYNFTVNSQEMTAYCDMVTPGGGWLVFQRRETSIQKPLDFYQGMYAYENGFGQLGFEFWWGLQNLYQLTNPANNIRTYNLRVDLKDFNGKTGYGYFSNFYIGGPSDGYRLHLGGLEEGIIGDSFIGIKNMMFCTRDADCNNMAATHHGGWWYSDDTRSNLNGNGTHQGNYSGDVPDGVYYETFRGIWYSLESTRMALKPLHT
ncbi:ficolin-1-A isoform X1 [Lingula anatina]|uniref:Ficolin-1-A isoform X1 n=1 Tax=Lingula anatina TaxID=7574 RepID=A0A1S3H8J4_LINAN|nr:ficolin-1-A isoform X1 [Lingula anatina]|eukprot:XP_013381801.1 ficolin-1-A isoform X1 [Lingula anatina]